MHATKRIGELLNVFYLLETPQNAAYGRALPTKFAPPAGIQCSDSHILTKGILNFPDVLERLRIACDSENNLYTPVTPLLEGQEYFRPFGPKQQASRLDLNHDRIGRPPKRVGDYSRFYDWHICSCILSPLELKTFQRALRVLLEAKQPIKITLDISVNPGEWVHPYGSNKSLHILANMGRKRSSDSTLSPLLTLNHQQHAYPPSEGDPEPTRVSSLMPFTKTWLKHPPARPQQSSQSLGPAEALSKVGLLNGYFIGSFLSQPLRGNKLFSVKRPELGPNHSTVEAQLQHTRDFNEQSSDLPPHAHESLYQHSYSYFGESTSLSDAFYKHTGSSNNESDKKFPSDYNHFNNKLTEDEELILELSSRNIRTLQTTTIDGIIVLGEYYKNERLWKQQTAALLAENAVSSIDCKLNQRNRLKSAPKAEAVLVGQFWATVAKAISLKTTDDITNEEVMCLVRDSDDNLHNCESINHSAEPLQRNVVENTIELPELPPFVDPQSPVLPFESLDAIGPKNIDRESLYYTDGTVMRKPNAIQASMSIKPDMQAGSIDHTDVPHLCPLYQNMRQIFRLFSADISISLNILQILFTNLVLRFLTLSQLLDISTSTNWYHNIIFTIRTGRITAVSLRPQQGSRFLFQSGKTKHRPSFIQLRTSYKYLPMDLSLLSVSHHVHRQQKTPYEHFLAHLEITRAAICRLLYLYPSVQYTPEAHSVTQLFLLSDHISASGLVLEARFFTEHTLLLNNNTELSTLTEVDHLTKLLTDYLMSESLVGFSSFNTNILLSEYYLRHICNGVHKHQSQDTGVSSLTSSNVRNLYDTTLPQSLVQSKTSRKSDNHNQADDQVEHPDPEATMLYTQLLSIYRDTLPPCFTKTDDSKSLFKKQTELDTLAPYLYYQSNVRYLLLYQTHMLLSLSASYITGNKSFIIRAPRKVGALRFVMSTFLTRTAALQNLRCACAGTHFEGKGSTASGMSNQITPSVMKKDYDSASLDGILKREQVHLVLCEEAKVEGFVNMYIRLLFGARVHDAISREMFGQDIDRLLLNLRSRKTSREQTHADDISSVADNLSGQSSIFYPSSVSPINFTDILTQKMLLDDMESTLFVTIFSCNPHRNSVPVAEITKNTAFGPLQPRSSSSNVFKCTGTNSNCNSLSINLPYMNRNSAMHVSSRTKEASCLGMDLLDAKLADAERHVRCVSYIIGPETENQKTISVPSRILFNLFDQSNGAQQSSRQIDQPVSIKLLVVTYDALHYNYAYTNGQILSLIKEIKRLDTLFVHRIKDHAPHIPLHMYKTDFLISVESTYLLNRDDDLRQEEETRKKLLQLQSMHSPNIVDKTPNKQLQTHDKRATSSIAVYSSVPSHEKISQPSCAADHTILSEQHELSPSCTDQQSEQSYVPYDTVSAPSSSLTRATEDSPAHLLFFDLVSLNYEPSIPVLTNIYDMKLLDKVLTDPTIALLFLNASKKGSCSVYLHDIHSYGPQINYRFPSLQHLPAIVPRRGRQGFKDSSMPKYLIHFPLYQSTNETHDPYSVKVDTPGRNGTSVAPPNIFSGSSQSSSLRHSSSTAKAFRHSISEDIIKLIDKFISLDGLINDLNASYNALLVQHQAVNTKRGDARKRHSTNFWSNIGAYMTPMVLTTTMNVSSLDSVASILARSHSIAFGRGSEENWLRGVESELWDKDVYFSMTDSISGSIMYRNTRFPSAYKDPLGSSLDMAIVSDIRRSFPEKYLNIMISSLERLQQLWISTDGSLFLVPASSPPAPRSNIVNHVPPSHSVEHTLAYNMSLPFTIYDKLFMYSPNTANVEHSEIDHSQKSLCFVSSSGDSWNSISRSVVYQTRSIPLLAVIELIDIFKRLLYKQAPHNPNQHDFEVEPFSVGCHIFKPVLDMLADQLKDTFARVKLTITRLLLPASHSYYTSVHYTQQPLKYSRPVALVEGASHLPNLVVFSMTNAVRLAVILPGYMSSNKVQLHTQGTFQSHRDLCIRQLATSTLNRIKNKLSYAVELENKATYLFKIPFKTQIQPKYLSMLHKRPLLQHLYQLDNQNTHDLHENFCNRIEFSSICSRIEANNNISKSMDSLLFFYRALMIIENNVSGTDIDTKHVLSFPFTYNFYSSVIIQLLGSAPSRDMLNIFGCLIPLKMITYCANQGLIYSLTREDRLVGGFLIASSTPSDLDLCSIKYSAIDRGQGSSVPTGPISLLSTFLSEINPSRESINIEALSSILIAYGQLCCATHPLSPIMYKILANSTYGLLTSVMNIVRLIHQETYTLNVIYTETPVIVAVCFAIRRLFIEFDLCGKRYKPMMEIIRQSYCTRKHGEYISKNDYNTLCSVSLQRLNNVTLMSATLNVNKSTSNVNSTPPFSNDSPHGSTCFNVRYTDASNQPSDEDPKGEPTNECLSRAKEGTCGRAPLSPPEPSLTRESVGNKNSMEHTSSKVLYTKEPPRKQSIVSKADELGRIAVSIRSEISAVDVAERANEPSEGSNDLSELCQSTQLGCTSKYPANLLYSKEQVIIGPLTDGLGNPSAPLGSHTEGKISKPYTLYHDNSDDNERDMDDAFIKTSGFNFILVLVNNYDTLHMLGSVMKFALGDCNANIIIPKSNEVLAYITSAAVTAVTTIGRRNSTCMGLSELSVQSKRGYRDSHTGITGETSEPVLRNLANEEGKCVVLQTLAEFIDSVERFRDAQRIHLFAMPCVQNILILEAIHRANMAEKIICWSNLPANRAFDRFLADSEINTELVERLKPASASFQDVIASIPDELQYMILNQGANKPLQQLLVSIVGLIKEFGYNVSQFSIFDDDQARFTMPKLDISMEQESLSTESQVDAEKGLDESPNNKQDAEITEYGSYGPQAVTEYVCKMEPHEYSFTLDCVHRSKGQGKILWRCVKHAIREMFQKDLSVATVEGFDIRHGQDLFSTVSTQQVEYPSIEKSPGQASVMLQETLTTLSSLHSAYSQLTLPLRIDTYQMYLSGCPLTVVKLLSQAAFLSTYSNVSHFDLFISSSYAGKLLEFSGPNGTIGAGAPTCSKLRLTSLITSIVSNTPEPKVFQIPKENVLLTGHSTAPMSALPADTVLSYPSTINLAKIESFYPIRLYHGYTPATGIRAATPENLITARSKAIPHIVRTSVPHASRTGALKSSTSAYHEATGVLTKQTDINKAVIITPPVSDKLKACVIRAYKRKNPLAILGKELKCAFYSLLEGEESTCLSIDFPESHITRISLSPITSAFSFKRKLIPFCERQLVYEDLHPSDSTPFKHQLVPDKPTMNLNQFVWNRQLVSNLLSVYPSHEIIIKSLQLQCRIAEYATRSGSSPNQVNQEYTAAYQQMYTTIHTIAYTINDSLSYRLHINNQICNHLIMRYSEVSKLLRAQPLLKNSAEAIIFMNITRGNNVRALYQSFKDVIPCLALTSYDKKVILYLLKYRKSKYPETLEIILDQYIRDKYAPRLPSSLCNREAALKYILSQSWSDTSSNYIIDSLKTKLVARIDELATNNADTEEAERSLIQLILYNLNCTQILSNTFDGIFNNYTTVQHIEATTNLAISNFGYTNFKRHDITPLPKECYLTITANRCVSSGPQAVHDSPPQQKCFPLRQDNALGLCSAEEYCPAIYEPPESYVQCWKPLW